MRDEKGFSLSSSSLVPHPSSLPVVVHFAERFVVMTQNWIYHQVIHTSRYRPVVATQFRENAELFPFDPVLFPETGGPAGTRSWVWRWCAPSVGSARRQRYRLAVAPPTHRPAYQRTVCG